MNNYIYKCFDCEKIYSSAEIEKNNIYLCPLCGKVEKNKPLRGVLLINYDYDSIGKNHSKESILKFEPGKFWQYNSLWPLEFKNGLPFGISESELNRISLPNNLLQSFFYGGKEFLVLDDTRNSTLSFKDRATNLVALKAIELGINFISAASTGNAGSSLAGVCSRLGLKSCIFVPKNIPDAKRIQIQSYGAEIIVVEGDYDLAFDTCLEISHSKKWYNRNTAYNPLTIEGKKSSAYDIFISSKGEMPEIIFVPVGDGVIISGLYKGLWELKQLGWIEELPKLIAVQASGSNALVRYSQSQNFEYRQANSIADSICAGAPRNLYMAYDALVKTNGQAIEVTDEEILEAQKYVSYNYGMLIEPSCAASFAGFIKYSNAHDIDNRKALLLFTGNGLKDVASLTKWNELIKPQSVEEIKSKFLC